MTKLGIVASGDTFTKELKEIDVLLKVEFKKQQLIYLEDKGAENKRETPDATKYTIKKYFKNQKFLNNNDFEFIDVHNEKLFFINTSVLLKIVKMVQDIQLKTNEESIL